MLPAVSEVPVPPLELVRRIGHRDEDDPLGNYDRASRRMGEHLLAALPSDLDLAGGRVLDFGCGPGRLIRHLLGAVPADTVVDGTDIHAPSIEWLQVHLPAPHAAFVAAAEPPLPRPDGSYRLICATSVFTHLASSWAAWLCECHRLLEPGGVLAATVMSSGCAGLFDEQPWEEAKVGMLVLGPGRPWEAGGPMVLHSEWWVREHWGRAFEIVRFEASGFGVGTETGPSQGLVVMRRRAVALDPGALAAPGPDPRELTALAHGLERAHAEAASLNTGHDAYAAAYQAEAQANRVLRAQLAQRGPGPAAASVPMSTVRLLACALSALIGVLAIVAGLIYLTVAARSLPSFLGEIHDDPAHRSLRGVVAVIAGVVALAAAGGGVAHRSAGAAG